MKLLCTEAHSATGRIGEVQALHTVTTRITAKGNEIATAMRRGDVSPAVANYALQILNDLSKDTLEETRTAARAVGVIC